MLQAWERASFSTKWVHEVGLDSRGMRFARDVRRQLEAATGFDGERLHPSASEAQLNSRDGGGNGGGGGGGDRNGAFSSSGGSTRDGGGNVGNGSTRKRPREQDDGELSCVCGDGTSFLTGCKLDPGKVPTLNHRLHLNCSSRCRCCRCRSAAAACCIIPVACTDRRHLHKRFRTCVEPSLCCSNSHGGAAARAVKRLCGTPGAAPGQAQRIQ